MSVAIDIFILSDREIEVLASTLDLEAVGQKPVTLWGLTNFELEAVAEWLEVPSISPQPICVDEASGMVAFEWTPELVAAVAALAAGGSDQLVQQLVPSEGPVGADPKIVADSAGLMIDACARARDEGRRVVQVDSM